MDINFDGPHSTPSLLFSDFKSKLNIPAPRGSTVDVSAFNNDGFSDFELDLGLLSRSPSPVTPPRVSFSSDADATSSPPSPKSAFLSPISSLNTSQAINVSSAKISSTTAASVIRGSWPVFRYVGRGTPIDPTRRSQWGGYEAAEDGRLHSGTLRSASLDSAYRGPAHRSASPDQWHHVLPSDSPSQPFALPEESKIQFDVHSDEAEWDSFMQTVLHPTKGMETPRSKEEGDEKENWKEQGQVELPPLTDMPVETSTLEMDLGLDAALDLGLGLGLGRGMNWFELGLLPSSGFDSPSVYSSAPATPRGSTSRPVSMDKSEDGFVHATAEENGTGPRANSTSNLNGNGYHHYHGDEKMAARSFFDVGSDAWWKKLMERLRKLQKMLHRRKGAHTV